MNTICNNVNNISANGLNAHTYKRQQDVRCQNLGQLSTRSESTPCMHHWHETKTLSNKRFHSKLVNMNQMCCLMHSCSRASPSSTFDGIGILFHTQCRWSRNRTMESLAGVRTNPEPQTSMDHVDRATSHASIHRSRVALVRWEWSGLQPLDAKWWMCKRTVVFDRWFTQSPTSVCV